MTETELDSENVGELTLEQVVDVVPGIYKHKDELRSVWDIWLHATHHAAAIGEEVRKYRPGRTLLKEIADFSMWLFTFAGKIRAPFPTLPYSQNARIEESTIRTERSFSEIVWSKYPGVCPVCFWRRFQDKITIEGPCDCLIFNVEDRDILKAKTMKERKTEEKKKEEDKRNRVREIRKYAGQHYPEPSYSIDQWQEQFRKVYSANLMHLSIVDIAFHLLEEVGEVSDAMARMYTYIGDFDKPPRLRQIWLEEEMADVFSWLLTLVNALQIMPDIAKEFLGYLGVGKGIIILEDKITLSKIIWHRYGSSEQNKFVCPTCHRSKCRCKIKLVGHNKDYKDFLERTNIDPLTPCVTLNE